MLVANWGMATPPPPPRRCVRSLSREYYYSSWVQLPCKTPSEAVSFWTCNYTTIPICMCSCVCEPQMGDIIEISNCSWRYKLNLNCNVLEFVITELLLLFEHTKNMLFLVLSYFTHYNVFSMFAASFNIYLAFCYCYCTWVIIPFNISSYLPVIRYL